TNDTAGYVWLAVASMVPATPASGSSPPPLATITFQCTGEGVSPLRLYDSLLVDDQSIEISHGTIDGEVTQTVAPQIVFPKGLEILTRPRLTPGAYAAAAANVFSNVFPDMVPGPGQGIPEADSFFDVFVTTATATLQELNSQIVLTETAPEAMEIALTLHDVMDDALNSIIEDSTIPEEPVPPPNSTSTEGGAEIQGIYVPSNYKYIIIREIPLYRCPNWQGFPGVRTPQVSQKEDVVTNRWQSYVIVQKVMGMKLFRIWRYWPNPWNGPYWVWGWRWLPAEWIKVITITPGVAGTVQPTISVTEQVYADPELADFRVFFMKDP
ncbi:MAG: hypothetical protein ACE5K8_04135, partial [Candidatus Zixiibacteriota bacterium]